MDVKLSNGQEITFDLSKMTYKQYKALFTSDADADETVSRVAGITMEELDNLPYLDQRRLVAAFFKKCREPLADPNSESAPTSV